jgi:hypothetical protein
MRTTLTLDPDVAQDLKKKIETEHVTLKEAVNSALRIGLREIRAKQPAPFKVEPFNLELRPGIDPDKLNQFLDDLEVEEYLHEQADDNSGR